MGTLGSRSLALGALCLGASLGTLVALPAGAQETQILQMPTIHAGRIVFVHAGDLWTVSSTGGSAIRLTSGVGIESNPVFSPDGATVAFAGEYDGNLDVFTVPIGGGIPKRLTWHPSNDIPVGWSDDGKSVLFRSSRDRIVRTYRLYSVPASGGVATPLPLPSAYEGAYEPGGKAIVYNKMAPAFGYSFRSFVSWGNYRGGTAGRIWITDLQTLQSTELPHGIESDFAPVYMQGKIYFLSGRDGPISVFRYDPATRAVSEVWKNDGAAIRSLSTDGNTLVFDRLGQIYTLVPGSEPVRVPITVTGDMPDVRPRLLSVGEEVQSVRPSPTGKRIVVEAHGEIVTVPAKYGAPRDITNTPGAMEREPAWSPDGKSIAYFSDAGGQYALTISTLADEGKGGGKDGNEDRSPRTPASVRTIALDTQPTYYFEPTWSPDSRKIVFHDNKMRVWLADIATGKASLVEDANTYGGFSSGNYAMTFSPDSRWLVYPRYEANHMHVLVLFSLASGSHTVLTDRMVDATNPAFDREGKVLYYLASNNAGATEAGLDMTSDLYAVTSSIYALPLLATTPSPVAPRSDEETGPADDANPNEDDEGAGKSKGKKGTAPPPVAIDLAGLGIDTIQARTVTLPLPPAGYTSLQAGNEGALFWLETDATSAFGSPVADLVRWDPEKRKAEPLSQDAVAYELTGDGTRILVGSPSSDDPESETLAWSLIPADEEASDENTDHPKLDAIQVMTDPKAEWEQMYREVWRVERSYFYDANFHGYDTVAAQKALQPLVDGLHSRADLNYVFQEMLTGFSVGHMRGFGGNIPDPDATPGGLLGADYAVHAGHFCFSRIYGGSAMMPEVKSPLVQPGLAIRTGDCLIAVNGVPVDTGSGVQKWLEGTAGKPTRLTIAKADGTRARDVTVVPLRDEASLRQLAWMEDSRRTVDRLSGGKLAYVHLPDTAEGGFTYFNRAYFAQTDKQGAIIDERFNNGGQLADYIVEVLGRKPLSYAAPRYGRVEVSPNAAIYGPKVMLANELSGSGGDALPWMFKRLQLGTLVGKRTWGGLVGIGDVPILMDGGQVTAPSAGLFNPEGHWEVENHGVDPDVEVEQDPALVAAGHDPQLEAAVAIAMEKLKESPPAATPPHPAYPVYPSQD
ncbi:PD40 domain-containing protein [Novosphingobium profundi]|nr:PD40 domain-containing protein [Novosphingobium profundi]